MEKFLNILLVTVFAVAAAQLCRAHLVLKYNYDALVWREQSQTEQFGKVIATNLQRTRQDAQKIAALQAQVKALTAEKGQGN